MERRKHKRLPFEARIHLAYDQPEAVATGYSANLARGGIFVEISIQPQPGTTLSFNLTNEDGDSLIQGRGEVIWVRTKDDGPDRPAGIAVRFLELAEEGRERLERVLADPRDPAELASSGSNEISESIPGLAASSALLTELGVGEVELSLDPLWAEKQDREQERGAEGAVHPLDQLAVSESMPDLPLDTAPPAPAAEPAEEAVPHSIMVRAGLADPPVPVKPPSRWRATLLWLLFAVVTAAVAVFAYVAPRRWGLPWHWFKSQATASASAEGDTFGPGQLPDADARQPGLETASQASGQTTGTRLVSSRATALRQITLTPTSDSTAVRISGNGAFAGGSVRHFVMADPPRLVLRIRGITEPYQPNRQLISSHLQNIRFGLHSDINPPELSVVLDLASAQVQVTQVSVKGNVVDIRLR